MCVTLTFGGYMAVTSVRGGETTCRDVARNVCAATSGDCEVALPDS